MVPSPRNEIFEDVEIQGGEGPNLDLGVGARFLGLGPFNHVKLFLDNFLGDDSSGIGEPDDHEIVLHVSANFIKCNPDKSA